MRRTSQQLINYKTGGGARWRTLAAMTSSWGSSDSRTVCGSHPNHHRGSGVGRGCGDRTGPRWCRRALHTGWWGPHLRSWCCCCCQRHCSEGRWRWCRLQKKAAASPPRLRERASIALQSHQLEEGFWQWLQRHNGSSRNWSRRLSPWTWSRLYHMPRPLPPQSLRIIARKIKISIYIKS